ncbi:MAG: tRNA uridine-5-carboxymethylaminomethyl(34) synthesis GTPase MnmE [Desulfovibrionaceae bacterium]
MDTTIVAIATAMGYGGIGIIRISGPSSFFLLQKHTSYTKEYVPWKLQYTDCVDVNGETLDQILAVYMPAPHSFTGEDLVELHCHGSPVVLRRILEELLLSGAILASPGEFSKRAFLNGKMDIAQAEAIMELIHAPDIVAAKMAQKRLSGALTDKIFSLKSTIDSLRTRFYLALDFPEEDIELAPREESVSLLCFIIEQIERIVKNYQRESVWQDGAHVVLIGSVNAGKSSLMNAILGTQRVIVSDIEGTTRDSIIERISLDSLPVTLIDTAGLRKTTDTIEQEGILAAYEHTKHAELILFVVDSSRKSLSSDEKEFLSQINLEKVLFIYNKIDLVDSISHIQNDVQNTIGRKEIYCTLSAEKVLGIEIMLECVKKMLLKDSSYLEASQSMIIPNIRQSTILIDVAHVLNELRRDIERDLPFDIAMTVLDSVSSQLDEIMGHTLPEDIMNSIFSSFCIGK